MNRRSFLRGLALGVAGLYLRLKPEAVAEAAAPLAPPASAPEMVFVGADHGLDCCRCVIFGRDQRGGPIKDLAEIRVSSALEESSTILPGPYNEIHGFRIVRPHTPGSDFSISINARPG